MVKRKQNKSDGQLKYLAGIMKEVGLVGFIVLVVTFTFLVWGTVEQKREFIDKFILLKNIDENPYPYVIIIIFLLLIIVVGGIYANKLLKARKEENNRIGQEKSRLQEILLKKDLHSSN